MGTLQQKKCNFSTLLPSSVQFYVRVFYVHNSNKTVWSLVEIFREALRPFQSGRLILASGPYVWSTFDPWSRMNKPRSIDQQSLVQGELCSLQQLIALLVSPFAVCKFIQIGPSGALVFTHRLSIWHPALVPPRVSKRKPQGITYSDQHFQLFVCRKLSLTLVLLQGLNTGGHFLNKPVVIQASSNISYRTDTSAPSSSVHVILIPI